MYRAWASGISTRTLLQRLPTFVLVPGTEKAPHPAPGCSQVAFLFPAPSCRPLTSESRVMTAVLTTPLSCSHKTISFPLPYRWRRRSPWAVFCSLPGTLCTWPGGVTLSETPSPCRSVIPATLTATPAFSYTLCSLNVSSHSPNLLDLLKHNL